MKNNVIEIRETAGDILLIPPSNKKIENAIDRQWFDPDFWQSTKRVVGQSQGRHITLFVKAPSAYQEKHWVLRHYYRGGVVAKVNRDKYVFTGIKSSRCYREVELLEKMLELNLPVPKPIAAKLSKRFLFYQADLLMEKLPANDLVHRLKDSKIALSVWENIGKTIADFHNKGIDHADLNAHNILIDVHDKIWLIDFDRGRQRPIHLKWQSKNMARLQRSLLKESRLHQGFFFNAEVWESLQQSYQQYINH